MTSSYGYIVMAMALLLVIPCWADNTFKEGANNVGKGFKKILRLKLFLWFRGEIYHTALGGDYHLDPIVQNQ